MQRNFLNPLNHIQKIIIMHFNFIFFPKIIMIYKF